MTTSIYLINPASYCPSYYNLEIYIEKGFMPAVIQGELALTTVAAMAPSDFDVRLCDENISPVDFDVDADFIGITGKVSQWGRMVAIAEEFRRRGKVVMMGGPYASLCPEAVRPYCDILVRGEMETIAAEFFTDIKSNQWKSEYFGDKADLSLSPLPRWDLYPNDRALMAGVQTSRGCPFDCEFCDVIQYLGRKQRHKPIDQVLRELDQLYQIGYRVVFLCDDNFTAYRARTKELLTALRDWNLRQQHGRMRFYTQLSIDAARDDELLTMCADAGVRHVYIGIETPNEESLRETRKRQNLKINLVEQIQRFHDHGIAVSAGMICGFDHDGLDIFQRQYKFAMESSVPIWTITALMAPDATPLHARLAVDGRLIEEGPGAIRSVLQTNIAPKQMSNQQLEDGMKWLCNKLYHPAAFGERMLAFIDNFGSVPEADSPGLRGTPRRLVETEAMSLVASLAKEGPEESRMWSAISARLAGKPHATPFVMSMLLWYMQIRLMYKNGHFWDPQLATEAAPRSQEIQPIKITPLRRAARI
jgi:hypothetical protein